MAAASCVGLLHEANAMATRPCQAGEQQQWEHAVYCEEMRAIVLIWVMV
jgi:hypothetical protein